MQKPLHIHDCETCNFVGTVNGADLYYHPGVRGQTVIARYSDEPSDYSSGMGFSFGQVPLLTKARQEAQLQGLLAYPVKDAYQSLSQNSPPEVLAEFFGQTKDYYLLLLAKMLLQDAPGWSVQCEAALLAYKAEVRQEWTALGLNASELTDSELERYFISAVFRVIDVALLEPGVSYAPTASREACYRLAQWEIDRVLVSSNKQ